MNNPINKEYLIETAFNLDKPVNKVTQLDYNKRYATTTYVVNNHTFYIFSERVDNSILYSAYVDNDSPFFIDSHNLDKLKSVLSHFNSQPHEN